MCWAATIRSESDTIHAEEPCFTVEAGFFCYDSSMKKSHVLLIGGGLAVLAGLPGGTEITEYGIRSQKLADHIRMAVLADLHGRRLSAAETAQLRRMEPDLVLLPGDLFDYYDRRDDRVLQMIEELKDLPMFYTTGNHELERGDEEELKQQLRTHGVHVLNDRAETVVVRGAVIELGGYDCRWKEKDCSAGAVNQMFHTGHYRILMSHRPHWISLYNAVKCDLVISGHAHGGQWRIPFTQQGLCSPQQGIFPKYTGGLHHLHHSNLLISRGLSKTYHGIPRLYNSPEIVIVDLLPSSAVA